MCSEIKNSFEARHIKQDTEGIPLEIYIGPISPVLQDFPFVGCCKRVLDIYAICIGEPIYTFHLGI